MTKQECIGLLQQVSRELRERGEVRYPKRSDFSAEAVVAIKAHLGPWPRALEAAGIKPPREDDRMARNREKRIRAKRRRREAMKRSAAVTADGQPGPTGLPAQEPDEPPGETGGGTPERTRQ